MNYTCTLCSKTKPSQDFYSGRLRQSGFICKTCDDAIHRKYRSSHKKLLAGPSKEANRRFRLTPKGKFSEYKFRAKREHYSFQLSFEQFTSFWQKPCHYCGDPIETIGLDRLDSSKGYELTNVVPCCILCNQAKNDLTVLQFLTLCSKIVEHST
jgi:hypothetical protein